MAARRRDKTQTDMQANIGLYPNWSWCWPVNRRIIYNRASVTLEGKPYAPQKPVIAWNGKEVGRAMCPTAAGLPAPSTPSS